MAPEEAAGRIRLLEHHQGAGTLPRPGDVRNGSEQADAPGRAYWTDVFTDKALAWLDRREADKPFCLMLHFKATHEPWNFHPRHAELYEDVDLPEPETLLGPTGPEGSRVPGWPLEILTERMVKGGHGDGKLVLNDRRPRWRSARRPTRNSSRTCSRCVAAIDENIGRVLDYLDQAGLAGRHGGDLHQRPGLLPRRAQLLRQAVHARREPADAVCGPLSA